MSSTLWRLQCLRHSTDGSRSAAAVAAAKAKAKKSQATGGGGGGGGSDRAKLAEKKERLLRALLPQRVVIEWSEEDQRAAEEAARAYSRLRWEENVERQKRIARLLRARKAAIAELPPEQRAFAKTPDYSTPRHPQWIPTETPPIPGYKPQTDRERSSWTSGMRGDVNVSE
eukprot:ctg_1091.g345